MSKVAIQCTHCGRYILKDLTVPPLQKEITCECGNSISFDTFGLRSRVCCNCNTINYFSSKVRSYAICPSCKKALFTKPVRENSDFHTCKKCRNTTILDETRQVNFRCPTCEKVSPAWYRPDDSRYKKTNVPFWISYLALITIDICSVLGYKALVNAQSFRSSLLWIVFLMLFVGLIGVYILKRKGLLRVKEILSGGFLGAAFCTAFTAYPSIIDNNPAYTFLWYVAMLIIALFYFIAPFTFSSRAFILVALLQISLLPAIAAVFVGILSLPLGAIGTLWEFIDACLKAILLVIGCTYMIVVCITTLFGASEEYEPYAEYGKQTGHGKYIDGKYYETYATSFGRETYISADGKVLRTESDGSDILYDSDGKAFVDDERAPYHDHKD